MRTALLPLALLGCSPPSSPVADAPPAADASPDAPAPPDAVPSGPIHVRVVEEGMPIADMVVLFHDPAGALIDRGVTDANGELTAVEPDGSTVTVFDASLVRLRTVYAARVGDVLVFGNAAPATGSILVTFPPHPSPPPGSFYLAITNCAVGEALPPLGSPMVTMNIHCPTAPTSSVMVALGGFESGGRFEYRGYIEQQNVPLTPGSPITITGAWQPPVIDQVAFTNVPAGGEIGVLKEWYRNGTMFSQRGNTLVNVTSLAWPAPGGGDAWRAQLAVCLKNNPLYPCQWLWRSLTNPTDLSHDFEATRMPWVANPVVSAGPPTQITWTADGVPTYRLTRVRYRPWDPDVGPVWELALPAIEQATASITLPALPPDLEAIWSAPPPYDPPYDLYPSTRVELSRSNLSYDELRVRVFNERLSYHADLSQVTVSRMP
ncbi:MAG TPA: hypothetical protein VN253_05040 [Kofleriaceae bacterium]|nr:hypothetical protein [Kofleriaceae bacterium]